jgi:teichoic acid transport system ATP-binding protein
MEPRFLQSVNIEAGFVRDAPNLSTSTKITMVTFGESITVKETVKDPEGDFNWLRFSLPTGQDGWISERLVTQVEAPIDEVAFMSGLEQLVQTDGLSSSLEVMGKSQQELLESEVGDLEITYDDNNMVSEYSTDLNDISIASLVELVGEPTVQLDGSDYLYHGNKVDVILYSQNGSFTTMTVKRVAEEKNNL